MDYRIVFADGDVEIVEDVTYDEAVNIGVAIICNTNKENTDFDVYEIEDDYEDEYEDEYEDDYEDEYEDEYED